MNEEIQTQTEQEKVPSKFLIEISLEDNDMDTNVNITGLATLEVLGLISFARNILDDLEYDLLDKLNSGKQ